MTPYISIRQVKFFLWVKGQLNIDRINNLLIMACSLLPLGKRDLIEFQYTPAYGYAPVCFKVKFYSGYVGEFTKRIYNTIVLFVDGGDPDFGKIIVVIIPLSRLGWAQEQIAEVVGVSRGRITQTINNTNFGKIYNLLSRGRDMSYIAGHYQVGLALAWALRLEGKTDHEKFKEKDYRGKANDKTPSISSYPRAHYEEFFERDNRLK